MKKLYFLIPVYNEEENLESCIHSLYKASFGTAKNLKCFLCLNGCIDGSKEIALRLQKKYSSLNIQILECEKGKLNAQQKMLEKIKSKKSYLFFLDADIGLEPSSVNKMIEELDKHKKIMIVGAHPIARKYSGGRIWKKFLSNILNVRSGYPMVQKSRFDVSKYHPYVVSGSFNGNISPEQELQSKIFFHGRMFAVRFKDLWSRPNKNSGVVGDDTFLSDLILYKYGPGSIRIRYDAIVYYKPFISLLYHYKVYKRVHYDLKNLERFYPKFSNIRRLSKLEIDKKFLKKQALKVQLFVYSFELIRKIENFIFEFSLVRDPSKIWVYFKK
jgi:glycosyltransferase involved in cell wall biosynthesis